MSNLAKTYQELAAELQELKIQLEEANDTIHAIRTGQVDAFIVQGEDGSQLYTLKSADHTYRIFIENMQEGAITLNRQGFILYSNSRFAELLGQPLEHVIGVPFTTFVPNDQRAAIEKVIDGSWTHNTRFELALQGAHNELLPFQLSATGLSLDDGEFLNIILTDLRAVKESERLIKAQNEELEIARKAMDLKDEFIGIASHELKTPLTSLKGYLQLMIFYKKEPVPDIVRRFIVKANESGNKLTTLVEDLLDVSKINAGKLEFRNERVDVTDLVTSVAENASVIYPDYRFVKKLTEDCKVSGNFERLEQVLMNFINNSVKYSRERKDIIMSSVKDGNEIVISVTDFGIGLTSDQQELIFERFYRVQDKNFQASGLGIGLYICAGIVKAHDGTIGVESRFGEGATFYFRVPCL
ncbi:sensor histidine kinase [Hufsiella ginkgonis]|uniref:histidine kinase n=1 Tax=Hufsiella ginkgonis TaxID=2695274 RepID=A0A7K1XTY6_9SPHI|nr:PAS domain-containing sensor histidine kinase [Hufsiella ginkgonis]MXV14257.1 PAS domain S-box protein [Hufsiella ginkgonis]